MAGLDTTYLGTRGGLVDAIDAAWSPTHIWFAPFEAPEEYSDDPADYPIVWIDRIIGPPLNETPVTDTATVQFIVTGIFLSDNTNGDDMDSVVKLAAAQAELYGIANLGNYGYNGQMGDNLLIDFESGERYGLQFTYSCEISYERNP